MAASVWTPDLSGRPLHENAADFTLTFRRLSAAAADEKADADVRGLFANPGAYDIWAARWRSRLAVDKREPNARTVAMRAVNRKRYEKTTAPGGEA